MLAHDLVNNTSLLILNCVGALLLPLGAAYAAVKLKPNGPDNERAPGGGLIADLKNRREKAALARRAKCEFLANMSHDLRTPINAVIGYSEMLIDDLDAAGRESADLSKVHELGEVLLSRINDILDFAKLQIDRLPLFPEEVFLEDLLPDQSLFCDAARQNGNAVSFRISEPSCAVQLDARKFRQIAQHAFAAINAVLHDGTVEIALRLADDRLKCAVSARGGKLESRILADLFHGAGNSRQFSDSWECSRIGLALARELTSLLGGTLTWVEDANATGFGIDLPSHLNGPALPQSLHFLPPSDRALEVIPR